MPFREFLVGRRGLGNKRDREINVAKFRRVGDVATEGAHLADEVSQIIARVDILDAGKQVADKLPAASGVERCADAKDQRRGLGLAVTLDRTDLAKQAS